ncbi:MAG: hypothetical protein IJ035_07185 [Oscillospiraceae bacterium]|nr:hypothetical protein [Oscillospiraceae bacterium]
MANGRFGVHGGKCTSEMGAGQHAAAHAMNKNKIVVITVSGRGDKDCAAIARYRGEDIHE